MTSIYQLVPSGRARNAESHLTVEETKPRGEKQFSKDSQLLAEQHLKARSK
jgi:hypothetical protein